MPHLDARTVQIVFLEMQSEIIAASRTHPAAALRRAAAATCQIAGELCIPVVASVFAVNDQAPQLVEELAAIAPAARTSISLFGDQPSRGRITRNERKTLALAGMSLEIAVLNTALDARRAGFDVYVLLDCCGGLSDRSETAAIRQIEAAGVTISNVSSFFTSMLDESSAHDGIVVMGALAKLWSWGQNSVEQSKEDDISVGAAQAAPR